MVEGGKALWPLPMAPPAAAHHKVESHFGGEREMQLFSHCVPCDAKRSLIWPVKIGSKAGKALTG